MLLFGYENLFLRSTGSYNRHQYQQMECVVLAGISQAYTTSKLPYDGGVFG